MVCLSCGLSLATGETAGPSLYRHIHPPEPITEDSTPAMVEEWVRHNFGPSGLAALGRMGSTHLLRLSKVPLLLHAIWFQSTCVSVYV